MISKILNPVSKENISEFRKAYRRQNVRRIKYTAYALSIVLPIAFIWIKVTSHQALMDKPGIYYLFLYLIITAGMLIYAALYTWLDRTFDKRGQGLIQFSIVSFASFALSCFACITLFEQWYSGQIIVYIVAVLAIAFTEVFLPTTLFLIYAGVQILFMILLPHFQPDAGLLSDNTINTTTIIIISWVLSGIRYQKFVDEFKTKKEINEKTEQLNQVNKQLDILSKTDSLTGVYNRFEFDNRLRSEWERCKEGAISLSLIMVDIDFFKEINDHYGHQTGDNCLKEISGILASCARRSTDVLARYGGDEFAVLLADMNEISISKFTENMRNKVEERAITNLYSPISKCITISMGVFTIVPTNSNTVDEFFRIADQALYQAKEQRNSIVAV